jgi:hypothetical protein
MITGSILLLIIFTLILFSIIGIFNKKIGNIMKVVFFYLKRLQANKKNLKKLPRSVRKIYPVLKRRRSLFIKKLFENYRSRNKSLINNDHLPI